MEWQGNHLVLRSIDKTGRIVARIHEVNNDGECAVTADGGFSGQYVSMDAARKAVEAWLEGPPLTDETKRLCAALAPPERR
jgi:hypothetical protein